VKAVSGKPIGREVRSRPTFEFTNVIGQIDEETPPHLHLIAVGGGRAGIHHSPESEQVHSGFGDSEFDAHPSRAFESVRSQTPIFSGDTGFLFLSRALRLIVLRKVTGPFSCSAVTRENVDLYAREGKVGWVDPRC